MTGLTTKGRVAGKIVYVTGAARGIGMATAAALVEQGATVFIGDLDARATAKTAEEIGAAQAFVHDVTDLEAWKRHTTTIVDQHGQLDILVNNAGIALSGGANGIKDVSPADWNRVVEVNGLGTLLGCQTALSIMRQRGGSIVNVSSVVTRTPSPTIAAYGFSKAGVAQLTRSVAQEGAVHGIRCNSVHPGIIRTDMFKDLKSYHLGGTGPTADMAREALAVSVPLGNIQSERDIALGILFLASDEARFITGTELVIDGGMTL